MFKEVEMRTSQDILENMEELINGQKKEIASLKEQLEQPVKSMPFESWIFSVDFGDAALYEKHCAYMKLAYEARDKEVEHYIRIATQARREK